MVIARPRSRIFDLAGRSRDTAVVIRQAAEEQEPLVSVLVCTCNRKDNVIPTVRSVQACGYDRFELFVLDQSSGDETERALADLVSQDRRLNYVRLSRPSKPRALNSGRALAQGRYILLTDDDCEVTPGWAAAMVAVFEADPRIGCVYGDVCAGPFDPAKGYIPVCRIERSHAIFAVSDLLRMPGWQNFGIGANMAVRADVLSRIGGWDPEIGPGARFGSGDDIDVAVRVLRAGYGIGFSERSRTIHHGFRYWESATRDQERYGFGMGAAFAKYLRCRTYYPGPLRLVGDGLRKSFGALRRGERPLGLAYPRSWFRGFAEGMKHPVDKKTSCFATPEGLRSDADRRAYGTAAEVVLRSQRREEPVPKS